VRSPRFSVADVPTLIRGIRAARGLTQEALARELRVTFSTVNGWENGRHRPIPALARRLVDLAADAGLAVASPELSARRSLRGGERRR
jgi:transcriptional regulator with XRE-family HTH domain